jgi:hypothetical protein
VSKTTWEPSKRSKLEHASIYRTGSALAQAAAPCELRAFGMMPRGTWNSKSSWGLIAGQPQTRPPTRAGGYFVSVPSQKMTQGGKKSRGAIRAECEPFYPTNVSVHLDARTMHQAIYQCLAAGPRHALGGLLEPRTRSTESWLTPGQHSRLEGGNHRDGSPPGRLERNQE